MSERSLLTCLSQRVMWVWWCLVVSCAQHPRPQIAHTPTVAVPRSDRTRADRLACESNNLQACTRYARALTTGAGVVPDDAAARRINTQACDGGQLRACAQLGELLVEDRGTERNIPRVLELIRRACDGHDMYGCRVLGDLYARGALVNRDETRAKLLYEQACEAGEMSGCNVLASAYALGRLVTQNWTRAFELSRRSCDHNDILGCDAVGHAYYLGQGTPADLTASVAAYRRACELAEDRECSLADQVVTDTAALATERSGCDANDAAQCAALGERYIGGRGVGADSTRARTLLHRACEDGNQHGCIVLGTLYEQHHTGYARAAALYQSACESGDALGCQYLADCYERGVGVLPDRMHALALYREQCSNGHEPSCTSLAIIFIAGEIVTQDLPTAMTLLVRACRSGYARACVSLADRYRDGRVVATDYSRALFLRRRACQLGDNDACEYVSELLRRAELGPREAMDCERGDATACVERGQRVLNDTQLEQHETVAADLFKRACDLHLMEGCERFARCLATGRGVSHDDATALVLYQRACDAGSNNACYELATMIAAGRATTANPQRARQLYQNACENGFAAACSVVGWYYSSSTATPENRRLSAMFYQRGCDGGNALGCTNLAICYEEATGVARDIARAVDLHIQSCSRGVNRSCVRLGILYERGEEVIRNVHTAANYFHQACENSDADACASWAAVLLRENILTVAEAPRVAEVLAWACDQERPSACYFQGVMLALGRGIDRNPSGARTAWQHATTLFARTCETDHDAWSCGWEARLREQGLAPNGTYAQLSPVYERLCREDVSFCVDAAWIVPGGVGLTPGRRHRAELLERACDARRPEGCVLFADALASGDGIARDNARANELRETFAAHLETFIHSEYAGKYHTLLGRLYRTGTGVVRNPTRAASLFESACALGYGIGCLEAADLYTHSDLPLRDLARAAQRKRDACELGVRSACTGLRPLPAPRVPGTQPTQRPVAPEIPWDGDVS
jgi:TPR repeat protein